MKFIAFIVFLLSLTQSNAASFDCRKASTFVEKTICSEPLLGKLDEALASNYKGMLESDFGGTKQSLKNEQLRWLSSRNLCKEKKCILDSYRTRVNETCEYGVVSGVHPVCTSAEGVIAPELSSSTVSMDTDNAPASEASPPVSSKPTSQHLLKKHANEINGLGFDKKILKATIYLRFDMTSQPERYEAFELWLAEILESGKYSRISPINFGTASGVMLKRSGVPSWGFLFQYDGDLFPTHYVQGEDVKKISNKTEMTLISFGIIKATKPD